MVLFSPACNTNTTTSLNIMRHRTTYCKHRASILYNTAQSTDFTSAIESTKSAAEAAGTHKGASSVRKSFEAK